MHRSNPRSFIDLVVYRCAVELKMKAEFENGYGPTHEYSALTPYWLLSTHGRHVNMWTDWYDPIQESAKTDAPISFSCV